MVPQAASSHYADQQARKIAALLLIRRLWSQLRAGGNWSEQFTATVGPRIVAVLAESQLATARRADRYAADVINELDLGERATPGLIRPEAFAGIAGDGRPVDGLVGVAVSVAGQAYNAAPADTAPETSARLALETGGRWLEMAASTALADTMRAVTSTAITSRPWVTGYTRMLKPPSCSRCAILAGKFFLYNAGFDRHPRCDCVHIPANESVAGDLRVEPGTYFDSLPTARELAERYPDLTVKMRREAGLISQEDVFGQNGAQAIRDGADMGQVVNARRGMQVAGHRGTGTRIITSEGATKRAWYGGGYAARKYGNEDWFNAAGYSARNVGQRGAVGNYVERRTNRVRLMPEQIYRIAGDDRDEAIRLLKLYGFVI